AVPAVLLRTERDVVAQLAPEAVELPAEAEGDRAARVAPVLAHAEAKVLALAELRRLGDLDAGGEKGHPGVAEPERRELLELGAEVEGQRRPRRQDRVELGRR